jgi:hypothetical protein
MISGMVEYDLWLWPSWNWLKFLFSAMRAYRLAKRSGTAYVGVTRNGVPHICIFVGVGREAWRITQRAIEEHAETR